MQSMRLEDGHNRQMHTQALNGLTGVAGVIGHGSLMTGPYLLVVLLLTQKAELSIHLVATAHRKSNICLLLLLLFHRHSDYWKYLPYVITYSPNRNSCTLVTEMYNCKYLLEFILYTVFFQQHLEGRDILVESLKESQMTTDFCSTRGLCIGTIYGFRLHWEYFL